MDEVATHVVVRPEQLELVNSSGAVVEELSYDAEAEEFAQVLENVLGGPPDVEERPGGHEWWPSTVYNQRDGGDDQTVTSVILAPWNFGIGHV